MDIKQEVTNFLKKYVNMNKEDIYSSLELPPDDKFGDISFPCFYLAKESKTDPGNFSKKLREKLVLPEGFIFNRIEVAGPYLNFFLDYKKFIPMLLKEINQTRNYGKGKTKNEKIMLEYISPNPLKDLHIGHLRQAAIGVSLYRILDYYGFSVIPAVYYNDSGTHIAKCLWAYDKWYKGNESKIKNKGAWLGEIYVRANKESKDNKKAQEEIRNIHKSLEEEKNKWTRLKEKLYPLSIEYFNQFYKDIGANFEKEYYDSLFSNLGIL